MTADPAMLSALTEAAFGLGMAYHDKHQQAADPEIEARCFAAFDRCFTSVRLGIALKLRLERDARASRRETAPEREQSDHEESERDEVAETERPERYTERDRDRESERASFPLLLKTLGGIVVDASALPGPEPAELPTLRELLATVGVSPTTAAQPRPGALKARLSGSAAFAVAVRDPPAGVNPRSLPLRRATGPPAR